MLILATKDNGRACWQIELQPSLAIGLEERVEVGEVRDGVVREAIAAKLLGIRVEHYLVGCLVNHKSVAREALGRVEVEDEDEIAAAVGQNLVAIVVPDFLNGCLLEILHALDEENHRSVKVAQIVVAEVLVVNEDPLATGIIVAPAVAFAGASQPPRLGPTLCHQCGGGGR